MAEVTFPQLIQRACGIDVHLKVVVATIDESRHPTRDPLIGNFPRVL